jgi:alanyl-tRNA synthetase
MTEQPSSPVLQVVDSTKVTFPGGATSGTSRVLAAGSWGLIVEETPFTPRRAGQPADTGAIEIAGQSLSVVDCLVGAVEYGSGRLVIGRAIPVSHGATGWHWVVVHVLDDNPDAVLGTEVSLRVDQARRHELSVAHTARHLSGLALNATLASLWSQGMPPDSLGHPNFDALALASSTITRSGFCDRYRIRTSAPEAGELDPDGLEAIVAILGRAVTDRIRRWLSRRAPIRSVAAGPYLGDPRSWECDLTQGTVRLTCGGNHAIDLGVIAGIQVIATLSAERTELTLTGAVTARQPGVGPARVARHLHTGLRAIRH